jgi:AraC-like DNA-binding protein
MRMASETTADDAVVEAAGSLPRWMDLIRERFVALRITPHDSSEVRGAVRTRRIGHLQAASVSSAPQRFDRTLSLAATESNGLLAVGLVTRGTGHLEQDGRSCTVSGGGFALYDTTRPFSWTLESEWQLRVFTWPLSGIPIPDTQLQRLTAITIAGNSGIGSLLSPMLLRLSGTDAIGLSSTAAVRVADEIAELAIVAAAETGRDEACSGSDRDLLRRVHGFVEENLADPGLDSARIAEHFFISTRTLHRLFARHGVTVAAWVKRRRLEASRRALCATADVPINLIAARYGFTNASYFSREFAAEFGQSPRRYRQRHRN